MGKSNRKLVREDEEKSAETLTTTTARTARLLDEEFSWLG